MDIPALRPELTLVGRDSVEPGGGQTTGGSTSRPTRRPWQKDIHGVRGALERYTIFQGSREGIGNATDRVCRREGNGYAWTSTSSLKPTEPHLRATFGTRPRLPRDRAATRPAEGGRRPREIISICKDFPHDPASPMGPQLGALSQGAKKARWTITRTASAIASDSSHRTALCKAPVRFI